MKANFALLVDNIYENSNDKDQIIISPETIVEIKSNNIEDCTIPKTTSAVVLFKNEINGRDEYGVPIIDEFNPTDIKQYVITTEEFLILPRLYERFSVPKDLMEGASGAYVLRDGTLFIMNEYTKKEYTPILLSSIDENGKIKKFQKIKE